MKMNHQECVEGQESFGVQTLHEYKQVWVQTLYEYKHCMGSRHGPN